MRSKRDAIAAAEKRRHATFKEAFAAKDDATAPIAPVEDETTWDIADVARYLGVGELTVRQLTIRDGLRFAKVGRLLRFRKQWVVDWLERQR